MEKECFGRAVAVVGMQYGSEGKGVISAYLSPIASIGVRIGAANAGHTVCFGGCLHTTRQLPSLWVNPHCTLTLGISSIISLDVLLKEIETIERLTPIKHRLHIDARAHVITPSQKEREQGRNLGQRIASTSSRAGLGIGEAQASKVLRLEECRLAESVPELAPYITDSVTLINAALEHDHLVLFEGTQGFGLSLEHGTFPFVTSRDTSAPALFAGCGINPYPFDIEVIGVARTYPIRVGGPSGPFDRDSDELSWEEVARRSGYSDLEERTSVTQTVRRVATFSWEQLKRATMVNRPTEIAITFADYIDALVRDKHVLTKNVESFLDRVQHVSGVPVNLVQTGPATTIDFDTYRRSILRRIR